MTAPCPRCAQLEAERDALWAAVRAERLAAAEHAAAADRGDVVEARDWRKKHVDAERAMLALLPPEEAR